MNAEAPQAATVTLITSATANSLAVPEHRPAHPTLASNRNLSLRLQQEAVRTTSLALYRIGRVGPAGVAGLLTTTAAVVIALVGLVSVHNASDSLTAQISRLQHHPNAAPRIEDSLEKVITTLPTRDQMPAVIGKVLQQAGLAGVALERGHYAYSPPKTGSVGRYELKFPLKAQYPNVRDFINRTLTEVPSAGLNKLRIERKAVGDALVNADVEFVVFVRSESAP
jgi:hypothetical protein